jgi:hypothetical protein
MGKMSRGIENRQQVRVRAGIEECGNSRQIGRDGLLSLRYTLTVWDRFGWADISFISQAYRVVAGHGEVACILSSSL